jgi:hypothetical protein
MEYQTVFDIAIEGYKSWSFPATGLLWVAGGVVAIVLRKRYPGWWRKHPGASNLFAFGFFGFAVLWTVIAFISTYGQYSTLTKAANSNRTLVVEGIVTKFSPMPASGHAMERFCVSGTCFEYSDFTVTAGFNNTASHGGPIREGLQVRVTHVGNSILKLEVAK